ncbi:MAG: hypothetical protein Q4A19_03290 [Johnsonella sp.]|nr:hypothetical protein [Johnsonella sp.]
MILIIAEDREELDQALEEMQKKRGEKVCGFLERGRILLPMDGNKKRELEEEGKRGQLLAKEADEVYLLREGVCRRIK